MEQIRVQISYRLVELEPVGLSDSQALQIVTHLQEYFGKATGLVMPIALKDIEYLRKALAEYYFDKVDCYDEPIELNGHEEESEKCTAHIVVPKKANRGLEADIGFLKTANGSYHGIVSQYDLCRLGFQWLENLSLLYAHHVLLAQLQKFGFQLRRSETNESKERIYLVFERTS